MVPVEKMQELGAVVNFWKIRIDMLLAELGLLHDLKTHGRSGGDRYASDRLLREIKKKAAEIVDTESSLQQAQRDLGEAIESTDHLIHAFAPVAGRGYASH